MELVNKYENSEYQSLNEYHCALTSRLDKLAGFTIDDDIFSFKHYILADDYCIKNKCLGIRVPGGTVGGIWFDDNNIITKISIDTNYVVKTYPVDVNEKISYYIGERLDGVKD